MSPRVAFALLLSACGPVMAGAPELGIGDSHEEALEQLKDGAESALVQALDRYDSALRDRPFDVVLHVERCRFVAALMYDELGRYPKAEADYDACREELAKRFPEHPEVVLYQIESDPGEAGVARAKEIVTGWAWSGWSHRQIARLHERLALSYDLKSEGSPAKHHALEALARDEGADTRLIAARWQIHDGERAAALATLTSPLDYPSETGWQSAEKFALLADLEAREPALALYARLREQPDMYDPVKVAKGLLALGAVVEARAELERAGRDAWRAAAVASERFRVEYRHGTAEQALTAYQSLRDQGWSQDPLLQYRVALQIRHPGLGFEARDIIGLLALLALLAGLAGLGLLAIAPVHYRGLARRVAGQQSEAYPSAWRLRDAWYALFAMMLAGILIMYCLPPLNTDVRAFGFWLPTLEDATELAQLEVAFFMMLAVLLVPLIARQGWRGISWRTHWSTLKAVGVGTAIAVAMRVPLVLVTLLAPHLAEAIKARWDGSQPEIMAVLEQLGPVPALLVVGLAAPVLEELVFRGVVLGAFARHLSFGWANVTQAALFAAIHMEPRVMPFAFVVGLVAGTLARRSGGLLAPMILHAVLNVITMLVFIL